MIRCLNGSVVRVLLHSRMSRMQILVKRDVLFINGAMVSIHGIYWQLDMRTEKSILRL